MLLYCYIKQTIYYYYHLHVYKSLKRLQQFFYLPHGVVLSPDLTAHAQSLTPLTIWRSVAGTGATEQKITHTKEEKVSNKHMI